MIHRFVTITLLMLTVAGAAETRDEGVSRASAEIDQLKKMSLHQAVSSKIREGWTLNRNIKLKWTKNVDSGLPDVVTITNPFVEPMTILATGKVPLTDVGEQLVIEYYDAVMGEWRSPNFRVGSFKSARFNLRAGESIELDLTKGFWWFALNTLPKLDLPQPVKMRVAFDAGGVLLRSESFDWKKGQPQR